MAAPQSTAHPGMAYAAFACHPTFSLAEAVQSAVDAEEHDSQRSWSHPAEGFIEQEGPPRPQTSHTSVLPSEQIDQTLPALLSTRPPKRKATSDEAEESYVFQQFPHAGVVDATPSEHHAADKAPASSEEASCDEGSGCKGWREKARERRKRHKREAKRRRKQKAFNENAQMHRPEDISARLLAGSTIPTKIDIQTLPSNVGGYEARRDSRGPEPDGPKTLNLEELKALGFTEIVWNGKEPLLIIHPETKELIAIGVGIPEDDTYDEAVKAVHELFLRLGLDEEWEEKYWSHKRGQGWVAVNMGMAYGFGNEPYNQRNEGHEHIVEELRESPHLRRLAIHQSESLKFYIPRLYEYYHKRTLPFRQKHGHLTANWEHSIFCSAACNLGPEVATFWHRDCMNLSFGFCAVHSLGSYDHTKGGHLVLKELKLIIQFPPGALILLPSAVITHGNIPVRAGETRTSFTQYTAGAVFRYVDNGFRTEAKFKKQDKKAYVRMLDEKPKKWKAGLSLWSTVDELVGSG